MEASLRYFPAVVRSEHESALDALVALDLPRDEAMDLVVAAWGQPGGAILAAADGGRAVAAVPLADGRWAACNAYPEQSCASPADAERRLGKLAKRGRRGLVAAVAAR
ncbi:hypothetical protein [Azospira restricta]|uniref:Uncharacterized protein n=1 Tax=Azospira restricta TaxID=404405 RepID=A0A974SPA4_9RHOO|nr:hypothetical protein [Azospira restricta]QRJ63962.1 hypothetical protein IWH25_00960 [Azospira restricta]